MSNKPCDNTTADTLHLHGPIMQCTGSLFTVSEEKPFTCVVCLKTFNRKSSLRGHIINKKHILHEGSDATLKNLKITLPKDWKYGNYKLDTNSSLLTFLIYNIHTKEDVVTWLKLYMEENKSKFVCGQSRSLKTGKELRYRCEHWKDYNREHTYKKVKGTGCKCTIIFTLLRDVTNVKISNLHHNHSLTSAVITSFHRPTEKVKQIFLEMFNNGAGPSEALNQYKNHIKNQNLSDMKYLEFSTDKSKMPSYNWVHHVYQTQFKQKYSFTGNDKIIEELKGYIECLNAETSDPICMYKEIDEYNFVIAAMTPFMKRISDTQCASELLFIDSIGSVARFGLKVILLMTKLNCEGMPVGVIITTNETADVIKEGLSLFLEFITASSFGGRSSIGPANVITYNSTSEITALYNIFPTSKFWLCTFHVLQHVYKWLWKAENGITHTERCNIYDEVKKMMYTKNEEQIKSSFDYIVLRYNSNTQLIKYINQLYQKKEKWCLYFRDVALTRDLDTINMTEHNIRILKENILNHVKALSPVHLLSYLTKEYSKFYSDKIISFVFKNNITMEEYTQQTDLNYDFKEDEKLSSLFTINNKKTNTKYSVNIDVGICSCCVGYNGAYCKHQCFLNSRIGAFNSMQYPILDEEAKMQLCYLAIGSTSVSKYFCNPLNLILSEDEQPEIEVVEVVMDHCENIQLITTPASSLENTQILELQEEGKWQVKESLKNWSNICQIMLKNPAMYTSALKSFNKHLIEMSNIHNKIIPGLLSFNTKNYNVNHNPYNL